MSTVGNRSIRPRGADPVPIPEVAGNPGNPEASMRRTALDGLPELTHPTTVSTDDAQPLSAALLTRLAELDEGTPEHAYVRNTLVELNLSLVKFAARRFRNRA
ncbi:RNA polymerase sigma factor SigF, partial [Streptomyces sp. NPDC004292]